MLFGKCKNINMGLEIERKFLVNKDKWEKLKLANFEYINQGYISVEPHKTIRVRKSLTKAYLTIKGITENATRQEFEYEIPLSDAVQLLEKFSTNNLEKKRYEIQHCGKTWEIDEFLGKNKGLLVAEIELESEDETFFKPEWLGEEVTNDAKYFNSNLTINPYENWEQYIIQ